MDFPGCCVAVAAAVVPIVAQNITNLVLRALRKWKQLVGEKVSSTSLEIFKLKLNNNLSCMLCFEFLAWNNGGLRDCFQLQRSYISHCC